MSDGDTTASRADWIVVVLAVVVVAVSVGATVKAGTLSTSGTAFWSIDISDALGPVFHPGIILGAASNATDTLLAGIGVYTTHPEFSLPVLADVHLSPAGPAVSNLTSQVNEYFYEGGTYAMGWNGSAWLVAGQAMWGGVNFGTLVELRSSMFMNLTALIEPYFAGGGIFAMGWNGSAWLIGGNSTAGVALISLEGTHVMNLTATIPSRDPFGWIQLLVWNGDEWMVGGERVLGTLHGSTYHDLLPESPYGSSGVYSGAWNGSAWLVGGGAGRAIVVKDDLVTAGPDLPPTFDQSVLLITPYAGGWIVGGKGTSAGGVGEGELTTWTGAPGPSGVRDLRALIPASFVAGEIQSGGWVPDLGSSRLLIVGEGSYDATSGYGLGAMAIVGVP